MKNVRDGNTLDNIRQALSSLKRILIVAALLLLASGPLFVLNNTASAAQVTGRSLAINNAVAGQTGVKYTFTFTPGTASEIQSMSFEACDTPVGACVSPTNTPTGMNLAAGTATLSGFAGTPGTITPNTSDTTPVCNVATSLCISWTDTTPQVTTAPLTVTVTGVTNPTGASTCTGVGAANCTFFIRMTTYSDTAYTTAVDSGNVASSITQPLTVNAIIEEELSFCVGTTNGDSSTVETYNYALPAGGCSALSGSSLNLGTLNYADVSVTPVPTTEPDLGDLNNGVIELNTNAYNGTTVSYTAIQQSGTNHQGAMRVVGATCSATTSFTDQCLNSATTSPVAVLTPGSEAFGMTIPGVNCSLTPTISGYSCTDTVHNLNVNSTYDCNAKDLTTAQAGLGSFNTTDAGGQTTSATNCTYGWDETNGDVSTIASSTAPNGVVPGEALIVEFAATPEVTTPTGAYSAEASYIATPEY